MIDQLRQGTMHRYGSKFAFSLFMSYDLQSPHYGKSNFNSD